MKPRALWSDLNEGIQCFWLWTNTGQVKVFLGGAYNHQVAMFMVHETSTSHLPLSSYVSLWQNIHVVISLGTHHTLINKYMGQDSKALIISHGLRFILARMLQTCQYYFLWHPSYSNDNTQQPSLVHVTFEIFSTSRCRDWQHFYKQASSTNIFLTKKKKKWKKKRCFWAN